MEDLSKITIIVSNDSVTDRDWNFSARLVFLGDTSSVQRLIEMASFVDLDIRRVIVDRTQSATEFLATLAALPNDFGGEVLWIESDSRAYLSTLGRGDGRLLYTMGNEDLRFYLEAHELVTGRLNAPMERRVA